MHRLYPVIHIYVLDICQMLGRDKHCVSQQCTVGQQPTMMLYNILLYRVADGVVQHVVQHIVQHSFCGFDTEMMYSYYLLM
jgi:hypothetical protein